MGNCGGREEPSSSGGPKHSVSGGSAYADGGGSKPTRQKTCDGTVNGAFDEWSRAPANYTCPERDQREEICSVLNEIASQSQFKEFTRLHEVKSMGSSHWHFSISYIDSFGKKRTEMKWCSVVNGPVALTSTPPTGHAY